MTLFRLHLASRTRRLTILAVAAVALTGCQSVTGIQPYTQVRVIDASPDAPALDVYHNSPSQPAPAALYNVGFGTVSSYIALTPGAYTHVAYTAGTQQQLAAVRGTLATGGQYTVLAGNIAANLQMSVLKDQSTPAPSGQTALRILGQSTHAGAVDLYLLPPGAAPSGIAPFATGIGFGSNTGYLTAPSGAYSIVAFPAGVSPAIAPPEFTGSQIVYPSGSARTIILIDQPSTLQPSGLQVLTADDFDAAS